MRIGDLIVTGSTAILQTCMHVTETCSVLIVLFSCVGTPLRGRSPSADTPLWLQQLRSHLVRLPVACFAARTKVQSIRKPKVCLQQMLLNAWPFSRPGRTVFSSSECVFPNPWKRIRNLCGHLSFWLATAVAVEFVKRNRKELVTHLVTQALRNWCTLQLTLRN